MAPKSSSTTNHTSQSSSAAENAPQTSTTEEETTKSSTTDEEARAAISRVAKELGISALSDEQCSIFQDVIGRVLTLEVIKECFARHRENATYAGSYTSDEFRKKVEKLLDDDESE